MLCSSLLFLLAVAALTGAVPAASNTPYCSKPPYQVFLLLSSYPPAQSYCAAKYPIPPATVTTTVPAMARVAARSPVTPAALIKDAVACDKHCAAWSSLSKLGGSIVKSACSCIQTQSTVTSTVVASPPCTYKPAPIAMLTCNKLTGTNPETSSTFWTEYGAYQGATPDLTSGYFPISFAPGLQPCEMAQQCATYLTPGVRPPAFVLYLDVGIGQWLCKGIQQASAFTSNNCNIQFAYAYSLDS